MMTANDFETLSRRRRTKKNNKSVHPREDNEEKNMNMNKADKLKVKWVKSR